MSGIPQDVVDAAALAIRRTYDPTVSPTKDQAILAVIRGIMAERERVKPQSLFQRITKCIRGARS